MVMWVSLEGDVEGAGGASVEGAGDVAVAEGDVILGGDRCF